MSIEPEKPDQWRRRHKDFDVSHLTALPPGELAKRLRDHVVSRGGPTMNDKGEVALPNGAWMLMLAAAESLAAAKQRIGELTTVSDEAVERGMEAAKSRVSDLAHRRFADDFFSNHRFVLDGIIRAALEEFVRG